MALRVAHRPGCAEMFSVRMPKARCGRAYPSLSMPLDLKDSDGAAERVLSTVQQLRMEVARRAGG